MITAKKSLPKESKTESLTGPQFSAISKHSSVKGTPKAIREWLTSLPQGSHVSHSQSQEKEKENPTKGTCGRKLGTVLAEYDHHMSSWRTSQVSLLTDTFSEFSENWPHWGMIVNGKLFQPPRLEPHTSEKGSGLWPTPRALEIVNSKSHLKERMQPHRAGPSSLTSRVGMVEMGYLPTPTARDWKGRTSPKWNHITLPDKVGGHLNPQWVEWLMGLPIGWTDLKPLGMGKSASAQPWLGKYYQEWYKIMVEALEIY